MQWLRIAIVVDDIYGKREVQLPVPVEAGGTVFLRSSPDTRTFLLGERIILDEADFVNIPWTLLTFGDLVVKELEAQGRAIGIQFVLPDSSGKTLAQEGEHANTVQSD